MEKAKNIARQGAKSQRRKGNNAIILCELCVLAPLRETVNSFTASLGCITAPDGLSKRLWARGLPLRDALVAAPPRCAIRGKSGGNPAIRGRRALLCAIRGTAIRRDAELRSAQSEGAIRGHCACAERAAALPPFLAPKIKNLPRTFVGRLLIGLHQGVEAVTQFGRSFHIGLVRGGLGSFRQGRKFAR